jgi:DNA-binding IclR family transcriptional regulator
MPGSVQSIERAAAILRLLARGSGRLGVGEISTSLGLAKGTTHGILKTLQDVGFVEQDKASGKYQLGATLLHLGTSYLDVNELRSRAVNWADALASRSGEAVRIGTPLDGKVLVVHHVFRPDDSLQTLDTGTLLPVHATALGKVLLAYDSGVAAEVAGATLEQYTRRTLVTPAALRRRDRGGARTGLGIRGRGIHQRAGLDSVPHPRVRWLRCRCDQHRRIGGPAVPQRRPPGAGPGDVRPERRAGDLPRARRRTLVAAGRPGPHGARPHAPPALRRNDAAKGFSMVAHYVMSVDQGTTSTRCILFDQGGRMVSVTQREHRQHYPKPGWVEHDAMEIWRNLEHMAPQALSRAGVDASQVAAVGIANQRETTVVWDRRTGLPIGRAVVWQDTRTDALVEQYAKRPGAEIVQERSGLPLATYFSATRLRWLLDHTPGLAERAEAAATCCSARWRAG